MKLFHFFSFSYLFFLSLLSLSAQPSLNLNDQTPTIGESYSVIYVDPNVVNFSPGSSGANQSWDFSQVDTTGSAIFHFSILAPSSAIGNASFPEADFVWFLREFEAFNYYKITSNSLDIIGGVFGNEEEITFTQNFTDSEDALKFPASFGTSYSYASAFTSDFIGTPQNNTRTGNVNFDGYGSISTPFGTYNNVLRMVISSSTSLLPGETETQYSWVLPGQFIPLAVYTSSSDPDEQAMLYFAEPNVTNALFNYPVKDYGVKIAGNPTKQKLKLIGADNLAKEIKIVLVSTNGRTKDCQIDKDSNINIPAEFKGVCYLLIRGPEGQQLLPFMAL